MPTCLHQSFDSASGKAQGVRLPLPVDGWVPADLGCMPLDFLGTGNLSSVPAFQLLRPQQLETAQKHLRRIQKELNKLRNSYLYQKVDNCLPWGSKARMQQKGVWQPDQAREAGKRFRPPGWHRSTTSSCGSTQKPATSNAAGHSPFHSCSAAGGCLLSSLGGGLKVF